MLTICILPQMHLEARLKPTWDWILTVMDATEAQLRFGASLTHTSDPSHPSHPLHPLNPSAAQPATAGSALGSGGTASTGSTGSINVMGGPITTRRNAISLENHPGVGSASTRIVGFSTGTEVQRNFDRDAIAQHARREFLTYALSLMRSHSSEHRDSLPVLDVTALRHIAYVLDGIVFYMRSAKENDVSGGSGAGADSALQQNQQNNQQQQQQQRGGGADINLWPDVDENENDDTEDELQMDAQDGGGGGVAVGGAGRDAGEFGDHQSLVLGSHGRRQSFFQRSESTLCLGCPPPDPFNTPMYESLPLADQPHLLQPNARREDLFGIPKQPITIPVSGPEAPGVNSPLELPPTQLGLSPHIATGGQPPHFGSQRAASVTPMASTGFDGGASFASNADLASSATTDSFEMATVAEPQAQQQQQTASSAAAQVIKSVADVTSQAGPSKPRDDGASSSSSTAGKEPTTTTSAGVKRKMSDHPDGFGNIYMQLKKKNFYTIYEQQYSSDDARSSADVGGGYEKKDDVPQDLSFVKEDSNTIPANEDQQTVKMDLDSSSDCDSETQQQTPNIVQTSQQQPPTISATAASTTAVRPQIIVTPRKVAAAIESVTAAVLAKNNKTSLADCAPAVAIESPHMLLPNSFAAVFDLNVGASSSGPALSSSSTAALSSTSSGSANAALLMAGDASCSSVIAQGGSSTSSTGSPSKSVIVRAGPSVSVFGNWFVICV